MSLEFLAHLEGIIQDRKINAPPGSYTGGLFSDGAQRIAQKVGEESAEVIIAALSETREKQVAEISDLIYHLLVLMVELDISLDDIVSELATRHK